MSRIAIFTPQPPDQIGGNNTTRRRIAIGLRRAGHEVLEVGFPASASTEHEPLRGFDLIHGLHAFKTGLSVRALSRRLGIPYVVSITGTDLHEDLVRADTRADVLGVLRDAGAILCASIEAIQSLREVWKIAAPCVLVPKGVEVPTSASTPLTDDAKPLLFLQVGGWRDVKNNLFSLEPLARLHRELPRLRLRFVGPILEPAYHSRWLRERDCYPFAEDGGTVDPNRMEPELRAASIVLNTSHSEGGANAVLEAMARGRVVLASDIAGNRAFLRHDDARWEDSTGVLYRSPPINGVGPVRRAHDADDFFAKARRLALDPELRLRIGRNAREAVIREHSPACEIQQVLKAYRIAGLPGVA